MVAAHPDGRTLVGRATDAFGRFRAGDREALDELVEVVTPLLWRTARTAGLQPSAAEDVVQSVWLALLRKGDSIRDPHAVVKWLITAARRESWRVSERARDDAGRTGFVVGVDDEDSAGLPDPRGALPEDVVFADDRQRRLWEHVQDLPVRCRQLIGVIAYADRPDYALIAESLGMPVGSIGPTRGRCLAKLRDNLASDPHWEGQLS